MDAVSSIEQGLTHAPPPIEMNIPGSPPNAENPSQPMMEMPPEIMQLMKENAVKNNANLAEGRGGVVAESPDEQQLLDLAKERGQFVPEQNQAGAPQKSESTSAGHEDELANAQREMQLLAQAMAEKENSPHGADSILPPSPSDSDVPISPSLIKQTGDKPFIMRAISGIYTGLREAVSKLLHSPWQWTKDQINAFADRIFAKKQPAVFSKYSAAALKEAANGSLSFKAQSDSVSFQPKSNSVSFQRNAPPMAA